MKALHMFEITSYFFLSLRSPHNVCVPFWSFFFLGSFLRGSGSSIKSVGHSVHSPHSYQCHVLSVLCVLMLSFLQMSTLLPLVLNDKCLTNLYHYILVWICFYKIGEIHFLHSGSKCKSRSWLWCIDIKWSPAWTLQRLFYSFSLWQFQSHDMLDSSILNICHFSWSSNVLAKLFSSQNVKINSQTQTNVNTNVIYSKNWKKYCLSIGLVW